MLPHRFIVQEYIIIELHILSALTLVLVALAQHHHSRGSLSLLPHEEQLSSSLFNKNDDSESHTQGIKGRRWISAVSYVNSGS